MNGALLERDIFELLAGVQMAEESYSYLHAHPEQTDTFTQQKLSEVGKLLVNSVSLWE